MLRPELLQQSSKGKKARTPRAHLPWSDRRKAGQTRTQQDDQATAMAMIGVSLTNSWGRIQNQST